MVAITTKYFGPTNYRSARVVASSGNGHRLVVSWDDAKSIEENHKTAAFLLAQKYEWHGTWDVGHTRDGYAFVVRPKTSWAFSL